VDGILPGDECDADGFIVQWGCWSCNDKRPALCFTRQLAIPDPDDPDGQPSYWQVELEMIFQDEASLEGLDELNESSTGFSFDPIGPARGAELAAVRELSRSVSAAACHLERDTGRQQALHAPGGLTYLGSITKRSSPDATSQRLALRRLDPPDGRYPRDVVRFPVEIPERLQVVRGDVLAFDLVDGVQAGQVDDVVALMAGDGDVDAAVVTVHHGRGEDDERGQRRAGTDALAEVDGVAVAERARSAQVLGDVSQRPGPTVIVGPDAETQLGAAVAPVRVVR
jgi:hypothetical protein